MPWTARGEAANWHARLTVTSQVEILTLSVGDVTIAGAQSRGGDSRLSCCPCKAFMRKRLEDVGVMAGVGLQHGLCVGGGTCLVRWADIL